MNPVTLGGKAYTYTDFSLIGNTAVLHGIEAVAPVPTPAPAPPANYVVLTAGHAAKISLPKGQSAYFTCDTASAHKALTVSMASFDQTQNCDMIVCSSPVGIDKNYDDLHALYASKNAWGGPCALPAALPVMWACMSRATSGETVTIQTHIPSVVFVKVKNEGTGTATFNIGVSCQ